MDTGANQGIGFQVAKELVAHGISCAGWIAQSEAGDVAAMEIGPGAIALQLHAR